MATQKIAVYGSLKKGKWLHDRWMTEQKYLGETKIKGSMYSLGNYPVLMETNNQEYEAEVYEMDEEKYKRLEAMENSAGYDTKEIDTEYGKANVFYGAPEIFTKEYLKRLEKVENKW